MSDIISRCAPISLCVQKSGDILTVALVNALNRSVDSDMVLFEGGTVVGD